jgi:hypothetical protein
LISIHPTDTHSGSDLNSLETALEHSIGSGIHQPLCQKLIWAVSALVLNVVYLSACNMQGQPKNFYDILIEIDNNVIEPNSAKQDIGSGQTIR